jgi:PEP-CTERM motif
MRRHPVLSWLFDNARGITVVSLMLAAHARPAVALPDTELRSYSSGFIYDSSVGAVGNFQDLNGATGPLASEAESGANLFYPWPGHEGVLQDLETTIYAGARSYTDFGTNRGALGMNFRPTSGTDRGMYPTGTFSGSLPFNSTLEPHADVDSRWTDTFVISGGTGNGTATVEVAIHGHAASRYAANGEIWYGNSSFETFGTNGYGFAQYSLDISYDSLPSGVDSEYNQPIRWEQRYTPPLPDYVSESPIPYEILTGTFVFEYDVPFALSSGLSLSGYNQITVDFDHTATLNGFALPSSADAISSGSGHLYSVIPEPSTAALFGAGLGLLAGCARKLRS